jgi:hypothetical protein
MFQAKAVEKIPTHILSQHFFPLKIVPLWDNVKKLGRARYVTDDSIILRIKGAICHRLTKARIQTRTRTHARTHARTRTHSSTHSLTHSPSHITQNINTYSFFTASTVTRTRLSVPLYIHALPVMIFVVLNRARSTFDSQNLNKRRAPLSTGPSAQRIICLLYRSCSLLT